MSQSELLKRVTGALEDLRIPYMVTGSMASSLQGEPRSTHDIDFVVALSPATVPRLATAFPEADFYFDRQAALDAVQKAAMFNVIDDLRHQRRLLDAHRFGV